MKGWRRRSNARYTPKVHALSPAVCRRELKDCATHGEQRGDSKKYRMRCIPPQRYCFFSGAPTFSTPHFCPSQGVISPNVPTYADFSRTNARKRGVFGQ